MIWGALAYDASFKKREPQLNYKLFSFWFQIMNIKHFNDRIKSLRVGKYTRTHQRKKKKKKQTYKMIKNKNSN